MNGDIIPKYRDLIGQQTSRDRQRANGLVYIRKLTPAQWVVKQLQKDSKYDSVIVPTHLTI